MIQQANPVDSDDFSPFVVVGSSKSGTTWLQKMLDAHPEVRCHFQLPILPLRKAGLFHPAPVVYKKGGSPFGEVFESDEGERSYNAILRYVKGLNLLDPDYPGSICKKEDELGTYIETLHRQLKRIVVKALLCDSVDKKIFGTKAYTDLRALFDIYHDAKVIHIVRDGRDVCVSKRFHMIRKGLRYTGDERNRVFYHANRWPPTFRIVNFLRRRFGWFDEQWFTKPGEGHPLFTPESLEKTASDWRRIVEYNQYFSRCYPERFFTVRYEALLEDGPRLVQQILAFLCVRSDRETARSLLEATRFDKLKKGGQNSFYRKGKRGDWKNHFSHADAHRFHRLAGRLLIELGYEPDDRWVHQPAANTVQRSEKGK